VIKRSGLMDCYDRIIDQGIRQNIESLRILLLNKYWIKGKDNEDDYN